MPTVSGSGRPVHRETSGGWFSAIRTWYGIESHSEPKHRGRPPEPRGTAGLPRGQWLAGMGTPGTGQGKDPTKGFATRAVHGATLPPVDQQPAGPPIYQTSGWRFATAAEFAGVIADRQEAYVYSRGYGNPTVDGLEGLMADLEGTESAFAFASGMAAIHAVVTDLARSGDRVVASRELYGGTYSLFATVVPRYGIEVMWVDPHDEAAVAGARRGRSSSTARPSPTPS